MIYSQYLRIESKAGGVFATRLEIIRAARTMLSDYGKSRQARDNRHEWIGEALEYHRQAIYVYSLYSN